MKRIFAFLFLTLLLSGCTKQTQNNEIKTVQDFGQTPDTVSFENTDETMFSDFDLKSDYDTAVSIPVKLMQNKVECDSKNVKLSGNTLTISNEGTYLISGDFNGSIIVDSLATHKIHIVLNGVNITSSTTSAIYVKQADKVVLTLADSSENTISTTGEAEGAIYSKDDLTVNGKGALNVSCASANGIVSKDDFVLVDATVNIESAGHGIDANDSVRIKNTTACFATGKDGIHAENTEDVNVGYVYISSGSFDIDAEGDGISAGAFAHITGGEFDIVTGGGSENAHKETSDNWGNMGGGRGPGPMGPGGREPGARDPNGMGMRPTSTVITSKTDDSSTSIKGIKSQGDMLISGGSFKIDSADDSIHSDKSVTVTGGSFEIASGDDAFHAEQTLDVKDGKINISESYEGLEALDIKVEGGEISLIATDDGLNAAGGTDESGFGGERPDEQFGKRPMMSSANGSILISGGKLSITASGDGIDANGTLEITDGYVTVCGPTRGDTATLDYDKSAIISGGTFIGTGASGMAQTFSDAKQGILSLNVGNTSQETEIIIKDENGKEIISYTPALDYEIVIVSSPEIKSGKTYTVCIGENKESFQAK